MSLFQDEQGKVSSARVALWVSLLAILWLAIRGPERGTQVWETLREICLSLIAWAGGSRMVNLVSARFRRTSGENAPAPTGITPGD